MDVTTGRRATVAVNDATVVKNFYTVVMPDGSRSDVWEQRLGEAEALIAPAVRRAIETPVWVISDEDKDVLSLWIALQYLRGPDNRRQMADLHAAAIRMQVGMGGIAYLRHSMSQGLGRDIPSDELEAAWSDLTGPEGPEIIISADEHIDSITRAIGKAAVLVRVRTWGRLRFQRRRLAISDSPIGLVRGDTPDFMGVGIRNAPSITVPLDRKTLLWLDLPPSLRQTQDISAVYGDRYRDGELHPSAALAGAHNLSVALGAERFVYYHPDDDPLPTIDQWVRPVRNRIQISGPDMINRDRPLNDVLAQIASHHDPDGNSMIANYTWPIPGHRLRGEFRRR